MRISLPLHLYIAIVVVPLLFAAPAQAFEADGFASGMSRDQIAASAVNRGLEAWDSIFDNLTIGKQIDARIDGMFSFCKGRMSWYNRPIDFTAEYYPSVEALLSRFGQPKSTVIDQQPWSGPGGGYIRTISTVWAHGKDRITLSVSPEGRDGKGGLRHNTGASITYSASTQCSSKN